MAKHLREEKGRNRRNKHNQRRMKLLSLLAAAVLLTALGIGGTLAFLTDHSDGLVNRFEPASVSCDVVETVTGSTKSSVTIRNTKEDTTVDAYIRVAVVANTVNAEGQITGNADVSGSLAGAGWVKSGKYYYYTQPVAPGASTGELLTNSISLTGMQVDILAESIQADEGAAAARSAWGVDPSSLSAAG